MVSGRVAYAPENALVPGAQRARRISMQRCSWSSRCAGAEPKSKPNAACSRAHQPAPKPQKARPPLSASRVATVLAMMPGARKVTGETSVPSRSSVSRPARKPRLTHGSGSGSQARPTCGIWMRWSIRAIPANPTSAAARARSRSQGPGASPHGNRDTCKITCGLRRVRARAGSSGGGAGAGSSAWRGGLGDAEHAVPAARRSNAGVAQLGHLAQLGGQDWEQGRGGRGRALRSRQSAGAVSMITRTAGRPAARACAR